MTKPKIITPKGILNVLVTPPGSKSITNRALILAALQDGKTTLTGVLDSEDTRVMFDALTQLGLALSWNTEACQIEVFGEGGTFPNKQGDIYVGNSGTTARFLTAVLAFTEGNYRIHGKPRMHQRPIRDLVDALNTLGANVGYEVEKGFPPLLISSSHSDLPLEGEMLKDVTVSGSVSSQFLTALLLASPLAAQHSDIRINVMGTLVSKPYIDMTLRMMEKFGYDINARAHTISRAEGLRPPVEYQYVVNKMSSPQTGRRKPPALENPSPVLVNPPHAFEKEYKIEPDASAASYFFAAAAICGGSVTVNGLSANSLQGDVAFADCLHQMNCDVKWDTDSITVSRPPEKPLRGITVDMNSISDTAQTLAVVALFAEGSTEITNIEHVRFKETDRIADLATELRRFGAEVEERRDGLRITPPTVLTPATVKTYDDHRMAMSFAIAGLKLPGVAICNPECTQKTFPNFFNVLKHL